MSNRNGKAGLVAGFTLAVLACPAVAGAQLPVSAPPPAAAVTELKVTGLSKGRVPVGRRVQGTARIKPYVAGERVTIRLTRGKRVLSKSTQTVKPSSDGRFGTVTLRSRAVLHPGPYRFTARKAATAAQVAVDARSKSFRTRYPDLGPGNRGKAVRLFNRLLVERGYYNFGGSNYGSHTQRAVLAFRKVNGLARTTDATPAIFGKLAAGKGGFKLRQPKAGRHVEVDVSRQVLVLADKGKPQHVFHISSGTGGTPSDYGLYRFYLKTPGFNSLGMYYSVYYNGGEATHGYHSVPTYPASHGCLRNPIPDSRFIYGWVSIGMKIWVYP